VLRIFLLACAFLALAGCGPQGLTCSESFAYSAAKSIVSKQLVSPGSAVFASPRDAKVKKIGKCKYRVEGFVDSQNAFGALLRKNYAITVEGVLTENYWQGSDFQER
jgi:hypothetical protein